MLELLNKKKAFKKNFDSFLERYCAIDDLDPRKVGLFMLHINKIFAFNKEERDWYLNYYKNMPGHWMPYPRKHMLRQFPHACNWYDVDNYM